MPAAPPFGRRAPAATPASAARAEAPDPALAAFREGLRATPVTGEDAAFAAWRRRRGAGRAAAWVLTFALATPGVVCFVADVPTAVSSAVEGLGLAAGWWLRRARRRHLGEIVAWSGHPD